MKIAAVLQARGYPVIEDQVQLEGSRRVFTQDPFGNRIELVLLWTECGQKRKSTCGVQPATLRTFRPARERLQDVMGWSVMKFLAIVCLAVVGSTLVVGAAQSADTKAVLSPAAVDRAR